MSDDNLMSEQTAKRFVKEWVARGVPPKPKNYIRSEYGWLLKQLAERCMVKTLEQGTDEIDLDYELSKACEIIDIIWYTIVPTERSREGGIFHPGDNDTQLLQQHRFWWRRDPQISFDEGFESKHYFSCLCDEIKSSAATYLEKPWLRVAKLDWIIVDILITDELCQYGERLKKDWLPGTKKNSLNIHPKYFSAKGNLKEMTKDRWKEDLKRSLLKPLYAVVLPLGMILSALYFGYSSTGYSFAAIYALLILDNLVGAYRRSKYRRAGNPDPALEPFELWDKMYQVWKRLEGPTVNPIRVKEALDESSKMGAVWDETVWAIVGRAIKIDGDVWVIQSSDAS